MKKSMLWPMIIIVSCLMTVFVVSVNSAAFFRPVLVLWFMLFCPGIAYVKLFNIDNYLIEFTLAVALSIAINTLIAETMLYTEPWSPINALTIVVGISLVGAALQVRKTSQMEDDRHDNIRTNQ